MRTPHHPYMDVPVFPMVPAVPLAELLPGDGPAELEIGFGRGHFLIDRANALPRTRFLGLETRRKWVHVVAERAARRGLSNIVVLHGDARSALPRMVPEACLERIFIHFPDPWWKARHAKRMLITPGLARQAARLLADDGELFVQTDVDFRARAYADIVASEPAFAPIELARAGDENPFGMSSPRENRCREAGLPVFRMLWRRVPRS